MARDTRRRFEAELRKQSRPVQAAFLQAIRDIRGTINFRVFEDAIARGDIDEALRALNLGPEFYAPFDDAVRAAFAGGAAYQIESLPRRNPATGQTLIVRFQGNNPRAERILTTTSARLVTQIVEPQRDAIRQILAQRFSDGVNPRTTALDIVGRVSRTTGRREGGIIGLTEGDARAVENLRRRLTSEGRNNVDTAVNRYSNQLLRRRGERIARTETGFALDAGRLESALQVVDRGDIDRANVRKKWNDSGRDNVRSDHRSLDGQVAQIDEPFIAPDGSRLMHPRDASLGAPADQIINCACYMQIVFDFLAGAR